MNVWLIQTGEPLPLDPAVKRMRTALLADKITQRGHSVVWWTSAFDHFKKEWICAGDAEIPVTGQMKIVALRGTGYKKNLSLSRIIDHRIIASKFKRVASGMPLPDIIVTSLPPHDLAYRAVEFARTRHLPVIVDIRDPWPDIFLEHVPARFRSVAALFLYKDFKMLRTAMQMADGLVAATNSFLEWGLGYAQRSRTSNDRVFYLGYKRQNGFDRLQASNKYAPLIEAIKDKFVVFFVGTISRSYHNPLILLEAADKLSKNKDIHFIIAGDGELFEEMKMRAANLPNVTLTGWVNHSELEFWLKHARVGVCPATKNVNIPTNKVYAYLSAGLPVISAFYGELKSIVEERKIGYYYPPNDLDSLIGCIEKLYNDAAVYREMSSRALTAFHELFDADKIYNHYADHIERMAGERIASKA